MSETTPGVAGISHVAISVSDLDRARRFYGDVVGLEELPRPEFGVPGLWFRLGDLQLHLLAVDEVSPPGVGLPHVAFHVPTDRLDATVDALVAGGATVLSPPRTREDFGVPVRAAFVTDPDGNPLELTDVGPLRP
jgi:glyoxylase I family protein